MPAPTWMVGNEGELLETWTANEEKRLRVRKAKEVSELELRRNAENNWAERVHENKLRLESSWTQKLRPASSGNGQYNVRDATGLLHAYEKATELEKKKKSRKQEELEKKQAASVERARAEMDDKCGRLHEKSEDEQRRAKKIMQEEQRKLDARRMEFEANQERMHDQMKKHNEAKAEELKEFTKSFDADVANHNAAWKKLEEERDRERRNRAADKQKRSEERMRQLEEEKRAELKRRSDELANRLADRRAAFETRQREDRKRRENWNEKMRKKDGELVELEQTLKSMHGDRQRAAQDYYDFMNDSVHRARRADQSYREEVGERYQGKINCGKEVLNRKALLSKRAMSLAANQRATREKLEADLLQDVHKPLPGNISDPKVEKPPAMPELALRPKPPPPPKEGDMPQPKRDVDAPPPPKRPLRFERMPGGSQRPITSSRLLTMSM